MGPPGVAICQCVFRGWPKGWLETKDLDLLIAILLRHYDGHTMTGDAKTRCGVGELSICMFPLFLGLSSFPKPRQGSWALPGIINLLAANRCPASDRHYGLQKQKIAVT